MAHLIDKDAILAEIESLLDKGKYYDDYDCAFRDGNNSAIYALKGKINTLEVKEVNLDAEVKDYIENTSFVTYDLEDCDIKMTAKHFFELGLQSTLAEEDCKLIWNIGDSLPYMSEEDFFKELLQRYKENKPKKGL